MIVLADISELDISQGLSASASCMYILRNYFLISAGIINKGGSQRSKQKPKLVSYSIKSKGENMFHFRYLSRLITFAFNL